MEKRKICVVTGTRAEYGLLSNLMKEIKGDNALELQVIVTGMHLSPEFGLTFREIEKDGFCINKKVEILLSSDTPNAIAKAVGLGVLGFSDALSDLKPDIVVILGDRFEMIAVAETAMILRIPIAHIHGGELTEGLIDDPIRHSITKMSHLHFAATEEYKKRIIQMGEQPTTVYNVGTLGIEAAKKVKLLSKKELESSLKFNLGKYFIITLHPTTLENNTAEEQINVLLDSLSHFKEYKFLFTKTNADTDGRIINKKIEQFVQDNPGNTIVVESLGQIRYLSAIKHCELVIGNSSSGLLEVPIFKKPSINIGDRQKGRLKAFSVIDCGFDKEEIVNAINKSLSESFKNELKYMKHVYGEGETSKKIVEVLKNYRLDNILKKRFFDI